MKLKNKNTLILIIVSLLVVVLFVGFGLNARNFNYNFSRRLIQIAAILIASVSLGYSAVTFQTITNNQILTPSVMGLENLYRLIQTMVVYIYGLDRVGFINPIIEFIFTCLIMMVMSYLLFRTVFSATTGSVYFVVLLGMIFGTFFSGLSGFMTMLMDPNEYVGLQERLFASVNSVNKDLLLTAAILIIIFLIFSIRSFAELDVAHLGRNMAINIGVDYNHLIKVTFLKIAFLTAVSTVLIGPIGFLSIITVSIARNITHTYEHKYFITNTSLLTFIALALGTFILKNFFNNAIQLSVIINFAGGLYFLYLILKNTSDKPSKKGAKS